MNTSRVIQAIVLAPLSLYPIVVIPMLFFDPPWLGLVIGLYVVTVAYIGMLVLGVPSLLLLKRCRATQWWQLTLIGTLGGSCIGCMMAAKSTQMILYSGVFGTIVAATTWFLAFRNAPG
jgi:hypothetical protein